jgi:glyoxylase-like metal-dependent hydrolase (beta-lactamase superfamily II)
MSQPDNNQTIKAVRILSTGTVEQHEEHRNGTWLPRTWWALTSQSWSEAPINVFVIEHRDGLVAFDTGLDPAIGSDPNYIDSGIGRFFLNRIFRLHISPDDALGKQLQAMGLQPSNVTKAIISHLHFDHIGGIADIPQAELVVSKDEWKQLSEPHPEREWILREHIELPGAKWRQIEFTPSADPLLAPFGGSHDLMGDGSIVLLPTPGHTPGSLSALLRSEGVAPVLLAADLAYDIDLLMKDQVPGTGDADVLRASYAKVRALKEQLPDLVITASHDPATAELLRTACRA